jgi:hypothetical protein
MNEIITATRQSKAGPRVLVMQEQYKQSVFAQLNGASVIGNQQFVIIDNFITPQERDDMHA